MKALVLGGNGFIGSHIVDGLLAAGHQVSVLDRRPEHYRLPLPKVENHCGDFGDKELLTATLEGMDVVYHLASTTVPSTSNQDPIADIQVNLVHSVLLLQLMVQQGTKRIVFLSSGGTVYGIPEMSPIPETHPLKPICSYGVIKVAIENYLFMYQSLHGIRPVVLRASNPYGERQGHVGVQGVIGTFLQEIKAGEQIEIWGDGSVVRDFIHVSDLAELCVRAGVGDYCGILNAGSGIGHSIREVLDVVAAATDRSLDPVYKEGRGYDVPKVVLDVTGASRQFDWKPEVELLEGIIRTAKWMQSL